VGGYLHALTALWPGKRPVPIVQEAAWARGLVWMGAENFPVNEFEPRTVWNVASRFTDYAFPAHQAWHS
jgi:hypothetical protein